MSELTGKAANLPMLKRVFKYVKPYRNKFLFTFLMTLALAGLSISRPMLIQYAVDNAIITPNPDLLFTMSIILVGILLVEACMYYLYTFSANWIGQSVILDLRNEIYAHINSLKLKYFDQTPIGTLVTRVVSDIETISDIFSNGILVIFGDIVKLVAIVIVLFIVDVELTLITMSTIPILLVATYFFKNGIRSAFQTVRNQVSKLNAFLQEHITGMHIVQVFGREKREMGRFISINADHRDAHIKSVWYYAVFMPIVEILSSTSVAMVVWWGAHGVLEGTVTIGHLLEFILFIHMMFRPIREMADKFNTLQMGIVSSERVFKLLDTTETIEDTGSHPIEKLSGKIEFEHIYLSYKDDDLVLKDLSFTVEPGQTLALVGATGSGKTSIINLLGRFYEYQEGTIKVDGIDVKDIRVNDLRSRMAVVLQDVFLFSDSVMNNITLNDPTISDEDVITAAKEFGIYDFIMKLPGGFQYDVKERGAMLSVGQRQLISFVRAYVHKPDILILDEATSSIDTESEHIIQRALEKLTQGRTSIVIAHRLATIQKADKILVLEKGQVVESGSHEELMAHGGHYQNLFELQF
ncbi:MAG: ATP-binding cassette subfamily B multidrug efflux pump [Granulosicoccus sp.]